MSKAKSDEIEQAAIEDTKTAASVENQEETQVDAGEEIVELTIQMDYSRPMDTQISIQVNGQTVIVQRGKKVQIKRKFAEAYNNAEQQRGRAMAMIYAMSSQSE